MKFPSPMPFKSDFLLQIKAEIDMMGVDTNEKT